MTADQQGATPRCDLLAEQLRDQPMTYNANRLLNHARHLERSLAAQTLRVEKLEALLKVAVCPVSSPHRDQGEDRMDMKIEYFVNGLAILAVILVLAVLPLMVPMPWFTPKDMPPGFSTVCSPDGKQMAWKHGYYIDNDKYSSAWRTRFHAWVFYWELQQDKNNPQPASETKSWQECTP